VKAVNLKMVLLTAGGVNVENARAYAAAGRPLIA